MEESLSRLDSFVRNIQQVATKSTDAKKVDTANAKPAPPVGSGSKSTFKRRMNQAFEPSKPSSDKYDSAKFANQYKIWTEERIKSSQVLKEVVNWMHNFKQQITKPVIPNVIEQKVHYSSAVQAPIRINIPRDQEVEIIVSRYDK